LKNDSERKFAEEALQKANEALKRLAIIDGLTQISNRRRFDEFLANEWKRALRSKQNLSLILCDIDFFKLYNDNYGHQAGDQCLQAVAQAINSILRRPADLAARYGGEEFVIILPDTDIEGAFHVSERIRSKIQQLEILHEHSTVEKHVTLSLGVASIVPTNVSLPESLLKKADKALYEAKEKGRNQTFVFAK
jgi:two-component system cell cycle response regulator